ncbi:cell envelope biogenesis protein TolA [Cronobacter sakazakii]|nr:cell envelope biogenesis protein TolA [Cronobacter sakazakii]
MSETTDLVVIEKANAMTVFKSTDQIEDILQKVEREVMSFVPDVTTAKGRKEIASLAYKVAQTKTYLDGLGKDLVAELKEIPKLIDANRKTVRDRLDELKEKARQPLTDYEVEQERIKQEEEAKRAAEELAKKIESDHEMALLMNDAFDRELAEKKAEQERQRIAHEEEIKRQAEERAKREAEEKAAAEIAAAKKREEDAIAAKAQAELLAKQEKEKAEREAKEALERAEREKQAAIEAEQRKAREAEATRMAEEKRIKDEAAARAADVTPQGS